MTIRAGTAIHRFLAVSLRFVIYRFLTGAALTGTRTVARLQAPRYAAFLLAVRFAIYRFLTGAALIKAGAG